MSTLHISAGGEGSRIKLFTIHHFGAAIPKHLLPIGNTTIVGNIVAQGLQHHRDIRIWVCEANQDPFLNTFAGTERVCVNVDTHMTGPMGPVVRQLFDTRQRVFGCAGDFFCDRFSWQRFESFHDKHGLPVSILIAQSVPTQKGVRFFLDKHRIVRWERGPTGSEDWINLGAYIFDPRPDVLDALSNLTNHKEDDVFDACIKAGVIAAHVALVGFNVNGACTYTSLQAYLSQRK